jgi:hypothetical protein
MRIKRAHVAGKIVFKEHPALAGFGAWNLTSPGFGKHRGGVHFQK